MIGKELDRDDEDGAMAVATQGRHEVREVGLHPFTGFVTGALPAELPAVRIQSRSGGNRFGRLPELREVLRLLIRDAAWQAVRGQKDGDIRTLVSRETIERLGDTLGDGIDERRLTMPGARDVNLRRTVAQSRARRIDGPVVPAHDQRRVLGREDDPDDPLDPVVGEVAEGRLD